jgi:hypothetical protein
MNPEKYPSPKRKASQGREAAYSRHEKIPFMDTQPLQPFSIISAQDSGSAEKIVGRHKSLSAE